MPLRIATWNVNSIRARLEHATAWLADNPIDVLALQETKVTDELFPAQEFQALGYQTFFSGQKSYNGVAFLVKEGLEVDDLQPGLPDFDDPQKRVLGLTVAGIRLLDLYIPNGQSVDSDKYTYKLSWLAALQQLAQQSLAQHDTRVVLLGDFNIAPENRDVYDPASWQGHVLVSEPERDAFNNLLKLGLIDAFRRFHDQAELFSWWDYRAGAFQRDRGLRIDHILVGEALLPRCLDCQIDKTPRGWERPSDHAPVVLTLDV